MNRLFTSESVTEGHPDKVADQISDAILDAILAQDPEGRVAAETMVATDLALIVGEITTHADINIDQIVRDTVYEIGYNGSCEGFAAETMDILTRIHQQSADIAMGVNCSLESKTEGTEEEHGAGDQGMVFGYATDETPEYMPSAIAYAQKLTRQLTLVRKSGILPYLRPDGKSQVTVEYDEQGNLQRIHTIVISTQHAEDVTLE